MGELDEQKQENLMLDETVDRMLYDMDEMRSGACSAANTVNKRVVQRMVVLMGRARRRMSFRLLFRKRSGYVGSPFYFR
ncbi:hypothetical protein BV22DRAFT_1038488 [Leucogyrophana mollusca]|uniref:Uncharacterized protein n=1 Tax=Leucogyrophana mollusca TaxID=85980 RepID=A0ACB8B7I1_9AGAM|nr:hypothetical protein BV22DRAFT_1038488 [Leucogyrophana mollusca]